MLTASTSFNKFSMDLYAVTPCCAATLSVDALSVSNTPSNPAPATSFHSAAWIEPKCPTPITPTRSNGLSFISILIYSIYSLINVLRILQFYQYRCIAGRDNTQAPCTKRARSTSCFQALSNPDQQPDAFADRSSP